MAHDPGRWRFFAYLNLFMFSMLLLVLADNFLLLFAAWELVGLSSYLLIGFWYRRRVGRAGRQEGVPRQPRRRLRLRAGHHGHLDDGRHAQLPREVAPSSFQPLLAARRQIAAVADDRHRAAAVRGRGGQERPVPAPRLAARRDGGPDPGQRPDPRRDDGQRRRLLRRPRQPDLRARARRRWSSSPRSASSPPSWPRRSRSPRRDIKRVLAYSTLSQLGYMFAALGVGAFAAAIFHLMTHGFFKGLLFLGSGSVIHAVHDEQDMNKMGGLWRQDPDHPLDDAHRRASRSPASRRWPASSARTRSWARRSRTASCGSGRSASSSPCMTALLHVPADGQDVLRREPRRSGGRAEHPRVAAVDDRAAHPAGHPVDLPRAWPSGCRLERWPAPPVARARLRTRAEQALGIHRAAIRARSASTALLILVGVAGAPARHRRRLAGSSASFGQRASAAATVERPDQSRCGPFLYRASLNKWWFDDLNDLIFVRFGGVVAARAVVVRRARHRRHGQRHRRARRRRPAAASARSRPAASRTTRWASPPACSSWPVAYLVRGRSMTIDCQHLPLLSADHLPAARRRARASPSCRASGRAAIRWAALAHGAR